MKNKSADGLRGLAACMVMVSHFVASFMPMMLYKIYPHMYQENTNPSRLFESVTSPFFSIFYNGNFAICIFFVLSGYVLTLPYFSDRGDATVALQKRLYGRYLRLNIPIASAVLISYLFYKLTLYSNIQAAEFSGNGFMGTFFAREITLVDAGKLALYQTLFGDVTLCPQAWTLKVEIIGSCYLLIFYMLKPKKMTTLPNLLFFVLVFYFHTHESIYYIGMLCGSLIHTVKNFKRYTPVIFVLGLYFGLFQIKTIFYDFLPDLNIFGTQVWWYKRDFYSVLGAVLVTFAVVNGYGAKFFESRVSQFLGRISFSLYLTHMIILWSLSCVIYINSPENMGLLGINFLLFSVLSVGVAILFEKYVDRKAIHLSHAFSSKVYTTLKRG